MSPTLRIPIGLVLCIMLSSSMGAQPAIEGLSRPPANGGRLIVRCNGIVSMSVYCSRPYRTSSSAYVRTRYSGERRMRGGHRRPSLKADDEDLSRLVCLASNDSCLHLYCCQARLQACPGAQGAAVTICKPAMLSVVVGHGPTRIMFKMRTSSIPTNYPTPAP